MTEPAPSETVQIDMAIRRLFNKGTVLEGTGLNLWLREQKPAKHYSSFKEWLRDNPKISAHKLQSTD